MARLLMASLVSLSVFASAFVDSEALVEQTADHHEHGKLLDAPEGSHAHQHGDKDDHHSSPGSPCDHHVLHCCCGHVHIMVAWTSVQNHSVDRALDLTPSFISPRIDPAIDLIFHIPIA